MTSSIRTAVHESLPYVDQEPTPAERDAAQAQIAAEISSSSPPPSSSLLPPLDHPPTFTPIIAAELERISKKQPLAAIDLSRYEVQDDDDDQTLPSDPDELSPRLSRAYATHTYLAGREAHLRLLDAYGKNAWLVANWQAEAHLGALERELAAARREIDVVNVGRRRLQDDVGEELKGLEETWKKGVGRVLETEIATEALRQQVLERQRGGAA
ncbi:Pre-mRNA-splicing factor SPF27 [Nemania sp. NC0429]|nr:Pre-mRNA-splicing factor SPF27 [Nemania sp. NC0429]